MLQRAKRDNIWLHVTRLACGLPVERKVLGKPRSNFDNDFITWYGYCLLCVYISHSHIQVVGGVTELFGRVYILLNTQCYTVISKINLQIVLIR